MDNAPQYVIEMLHITKEFNGVKANDDITLQLKKGEIHALLGENGAGKSTLMSILFGMLQPEAGTIKKNGQEVHIASPNDATALHIGMVHQHFKLIDVFSVLDNIILGAEDTRMGFLQRERGAPQGKGAVRAVRTKGRSGRQGRKHYRRYAAARRDTQNAVSR